MLIMTKYFYNFRGWWLVSLLLLNPLAFADSANIDANPTNALTLIYSGNLDGELEPCGCSPEGDSGGIRRRATKLAELRQDNPRLILLSSGGLINNTSPNDRITADYIFKGFATLGFDAIGVQWRDLAFGLDAVTKRSLPWVASNWEANNNAENDRPLHHIDIVRDNVTIAFFAWIDPSQSPHRKMLGQHALVNNDISNLAQMLASAKQKNKMVVLSTAEPLDQIEKTIPLQNIDILIIQSAYEVYAEPHRILQKDDAHLTVVLQPGSRGMRLGRLDLHTDNHGNIREFQSSVIALPTTIPDDPKMADWYASYNATVKTDYLQRVEARKAQASGIRPYIGVKACKTCHPREYQIWRKSDHANAFNTLAKVSKSFDPGCLRCHTVAFHQEGGFLDDLITHHLANVQCESCHGAANEHVKSQGQKPLSNPQVDAAICKQCHNHEHSPTFKFEHYWPKIHHPATLTK